MSDMKFRSKEWLYQLIVFQVQIILKNFILNSMYIEPFFSGLCDFQYLPMEKNEQSPTEENSDKFVSIIDQVVPQKLTTVDWLDGPGPVFMSPPVFSRMDVPVVSLEIVT